MAAKRPHSYRIAIGFPLGSQNALCFLKHCRKDQQQEANFCRRGRAESCSLVRSSSTRSARILLAHRGAAQNKKGRSPHCDDAPLPASLNYAVDAMSQAKMVAASVQLLNSQGLDELATRIFADGMWAALRVTAAEQLRSSARRCGWLRAADGAACVCR